MTHGPDVLVVAPDAELRRSIAFALEAEGLCIASRPDLPDAAEPAFWDARCSVVDEDAVEAAPDGWRRLAALTQPQVLLVDRLAVPEACAAVALRKPLLGRGLVEAVLAAIALRENP